MKMAAARRKWQDVVNAATSGDPERMETAVSVFTPIVETFFMDENTNRRITDTEQDE
jgi:hypothetical protein